MPAKPLHVERCPPHIQGDRDQLVRGFGEPDVTAPPANAARSEQIATVGAQAAMPLTEYKPGAAFPGVIGRTTAESSPA